LVDSVENTGMLVMCVAVLVSIVFTDKHELGNINANVRFEQLWRRFVKCREMLMALGDLYVVGHSMRNLISLPTFITRKLWFH